MPRETADQSDGKQVRVGAVEYLNARPLTHALAEFLPDAKIVFDLPSRLADRLSRGELDVALIPSIEFFRTEGARVVSDACVACDGPVKSVKLYSRVPLEKIATLALDEGSRTSAAMTRLLLKERFGIEPELLQLPIGDGVGDSPADAVMLIGDRAMLPVDGAFHTIWDLGEQWSLWTGLPFVFAMWVARPGIELGQMHDAFAAARDRGIGQIDEIARREACSLGVPEEECRVYLRDHLLFHLGPRERQGLETFCQLARQNSLIPPDAQIDFYQHDVA